MRRAGHEAGSLQHVDEGISARRLSAIVSHSSANTARPVDRPAIDTASKSIPLVRPIARRLAERFARHRSQHLAHERHEHIIRSMSRRPDARAHMADTVITTAAAPTAHHTQFCWNHTPTACTTRVATGICALLARKVAANLGTTNTTITPTAAVTASRTVIGYASASFYL